MRTSVLYFRGIYEAESIKVVEVSRESVSNYRRLQRPAA